MGKIPWNHGDDFMLPSNNHDDDLKETRFEGSFLTWKSLFDYDGFGGGGPIGGGGGLIGGDGGFIDPLNGCEPCHMLPLDIWLAISLASVTASLNVFE